LFEHRGVSFTQDFGEVFERLAGELLRSVCRETNLWYERDSPHAAALQKSGRGHGLADWIYSGATRLVLVECKSMRPNITLVSIASAEELDGVAERLARALEQLGEHYQAIQDGQWVAEGLRPGPGVFLIVTYGQLECLSTPWFEERVRVHLDDSKMGGVPFCVLSIEELDTVIRLIELGRPLDKLAVHIAEKGPHSLRDLFFEEEAKNVISTFSRARWESFAETVRGGA
jgi:hypothetical protein